MNNERFPPSAVVVSNPDSYLCMIGATLTSSATTGSLINISDHAILKISHATINLTSTHSTFVQLLSFCKVRLSSVDVFAEQTDTELIISHGWVEVISSVWTVGNGAVALLKTGSEASFIRCTLICKNVCQYQLDNHWGSGVFLVEQGLNSTESISLSIIDSTVSVISSSTISAVVFAYDNNLNLHFLSSTFTLSHGPFINLQSANTSHSAECVFSNITRNSNYNLVDSLSSIKGDTLRMEQVLEETLVELSRFNHLVHLSRPQHTLTGQISHPIICHCPQDVTLRFTTSRISTSDLPCIFCPCSTSLYLMVYDCDNHLEYLGSETASIVSSTDITIGGVGWLRIASYNGHSIQSKGGCIHILGGVTLNIISAFDMANYIITSGTLLRQARYSLSVPDSTSTQYSLTFSHHNGFSMNSLVVLVQKDNCPIFAFDCERDCQMVSISSHSLSIGQYYVYLGGFLSVDSKRMGIYETSNNLEYQKGTPLVIGSYVSYLISQSTNKCYLFSDMNECVVSTLPAVSFATALHINSTVHISWIESPSTELSQIYIYRNFKELAVVKTGVGYVTLPVSEEEQAFDLYGISSSGCILSTVHLRAAPCGIPTILIHTKDEKPISSKETKIPISFDLLDESNANHNVHISDFTSTIKGRGNTSWKMPKKSYTIGFQKKCSILGMKKCKKWALLANYADKTLLRNLLVGVLNQDVFHKNWNPYYVSVNLIINGIYQGLYTICESIRIDDNRVAIPSIDKMDNYLDGGFIVEIDFRHDADLCSLVNGLYHCVKDPDEIGIDTWQYIIQQIQSLEGAIYSIPVDVATYRQWLDVDSFIDWYLVNELTKNTDAAFVSSVFFYYDPLQGLFKMGPTWDFDIACGNINYNDCDDPTGWRLKSVHWSVFLFQDPEFCDQLKHRWNQVRTEIDTWIHKTILMQAQVLKYAAELNFIRWPVLGQYVWPNAKGYEARQTYESEIFYLVNWLDQRFLWMDEEIQLLLI